LHPSINLLALNEGTCLQIIADVKKPLLISFRRHIKVFIPYNASKFRGIPSADPILINIFNSPKKVNLDNIVVLSSVIIVSDRILQFS
jgi:hypothetical protein